MLDQYSIYPKEFKDLKHRINEKKCFIIMPFKPETEEICETIKNAVKYCGLDYDRSDDLRKSSPFINKIIQSIASAYYLIVDISGLNENVLYELGIAHTLRDADRVLILKDMDTKYPSDLAHITYFAYDKSKPSQLYKHVVNFIQSNHYINNLKELIILLNIAEDSSDLTQSLNILQTYLSNHCISLVNILNNMSEQLNDNEINEILVGLGNLYINNYLNNLNIGNIYLKLICFLLQKLKKEVNLSYFSHMIFSNADVDYENFELLNFRIDIANLLINFENENKEVYNWIKVFLYNSSPASVDVARYKLHVGIINSNSKMINKFLLDILIHEKNTALIEHSINLCKTKQIKESVPEALSILANTDNPYVFRSAIDLISEVGSIHQQDEMLSIFSKKKEFTDKYDFINCHVSNALSKRNQL